MERGLVTKGLLARFVHLTCMTDENRHHFYELVTMFNQLHGEYKKIKNIDEQKKILDQCRFLIDAAKGLLMPQRG